MDNENKLTDFENEYYFEINNYVVRDKDLIDAKVPQKILAYEVYLRKAFGDSFAKTSADDDYDKNFRRRVEKLTKDKLDNSELATILEDISKSEFDNNLDVILSLNKENLMKQNMLITSYDYDVSKRLAEKLAEVFSMRTLDLIGLFEFDHIPNTFSEIYKLNGKKYIEKELRSIFKMELDFDNVVFVANLGFADMLQDLFYKIKLSNFVILLKKDIETECAEIKNKQFDTEEQKDFFSLGKEQILNQERLIEAECADVVVDITNFSDDEIIEKIIDKIKNYYSVN